jgi:hypothetical protein
MELFIHRGFATVNVAKYKFSGLIRTAEIARYLGVATSTITRAIEKMVEGTGGKRNAT